MQTEAEQAEAKGERAEYFSGDEYDLREDGFYIPTALRDILTKKPVDESPRMLTPTELVAGLQALNLLRVEPGALGSAEVRLPSPLVRRMRPDLPQAMICAPAFVADATYWVTIELYIPGFDPTRPVDQKTPGASGRVYAYVPNAPTAREASNE